jgi:aryl-alcohol dehydrogenase-like predicted oxidoreductase
MRLTDLPCLGIPGERPISALGLGFDPATSTRRGAALDALIAVVRDAVALGVTLVDVADDDDAVKVVADAVREVGRRDRVVIATRIMPAVARHDTLLARMAPGYVVARVEATLRTSRLDAVPLVQLAGVRAAWLEASAWPEVVGTCERLRREGKLLGWGVAIDDLAPPPPIIIGARPTAAVAGPRDTVEALRPLLATGLATLALPFHLWGRLAAPLIAAAHERGVAIFARRPLDGGALAGDLAPGVRLAPRDDRAALTPARLAAIAVALAPLAALVRDPPPAVRGHEAHAIYDRACVARPPYLECRTVAELALRFVLDHPGVTAAVPLISTAAHLQVALLAAAAPPLSAELAERLDANLIPPP